VVVPCGSWWFYLGQLVVHWQLVVQCGSWWYTGAVGGTLVVGGSKNILEMTFEEIVLMRMSTSGCPPVDVHQWISSCGHPKTPGF